MQKEKMMTLQTKLMLTTYIYPLEQYVVVEKVSLNNKGSDTQMRLWLSHKSTLESILGILCGLTLD